MNESLLIEIWNLTLSNDISIYKRYSKSFVNRQSLPSAYL